MDAAAPTAAARADGAVPVSARLEAALRTLPAEALTDPAPAPPGPGPGPGPDPGPGPGPGGRLAAALVLVADAPAPGLVLTRRREDLRHHPGQVAFPGGRVDPGETVEGAALREAQEEVGLDPASATVLGRLPAVFIPPSRFWLQPVVARWDRPHPLAAAEAEVAEVLHVPLAVLTDPERWRAVRISSAGWSWAWQLDERHVLWGATAIVTAVVLGLVDPAWHGGLDPARLAPHLEVRPWELPGARAGTLPRPGPPRLHGVEAVPVTRVDPHDAGRPDGPALEAAARAVADAVVRLAGERCGEGVTVLAGSGGKGAAGAAAAALLRGRGIPVHERWTGSAPPAGAGPGEPFSGALPPGAVVVDAMVGGALQGPLRGAAVAAVHALRTSTSPVLVVDLPSGLDPLGGFVGELVAGDVTVAIGGPRAGLFTPGLAPFVGDLYVAAGGRLRRVVPADPGAPAPEGGWRE